MGLLLALGLLSGCGSTVTTGMVDLAPPPMGYATTTGVTPQVAAIAPPSTNAPATVASNGDPH